MKAEQLYYTSCENGLENASGFQIKAMSNGFTKTNDVRQLGAYEPARDLPSQPNEEELKKFPILFKYKDNIFVRSVYVGRDYTQRFGNYFMHTLEVDEIDFYPIDLYFWDGWVSNEEKVGSLDLDPIEIEKVSSQIFILDNEELLSKLIAALFLKDKQIVIKTSNQTEGIKLLNFMQKAFPLNIAKNITFSTYQFSYTDCLDINLVIGDTEWEHIDKSGFYFFDLTKDLYPEISIDNKYSQFIVKILNNPTRLEQFYSFFKSFNIDTLDSNLNFILELFLFIDSSKKIDSLGEVLSFVSGYMKKEYKEDFLKYLEPIIRNIKTTNELEIVLSFYVDIFSNVTLSNINEILANLLNMSLKGDYPFSRFESFMKKVNQKDSDFEKSFAQYFLKQIEKDKINIDENDFYLLMKKLKDYIIITKNNILSYEDFQDIIVNHIKDKKVIDFKTIALFEVEQQRKLLILISNILSDDEIKKMVQFFISYYEGKNYFITIKYLINTEVKKTFIVFAFEYKFNNMKSKKEFLDEYISKIGDYPEIYYNLLDEEQKKSQIKKWINTIESYQEYDFFNDIWQQINESLFDSFMSNHIILDLYYKKYNHIKLEAPNKFLIREAIFKYEIINKNLLRQIKTLEEQDYEIFLSSFFFNLDRNKIKGRHFQFLVHPKYKKLFLIFLKKEKILDIIELYLDGLGEIEEDIENILIKIISELKKEHLSLLQNMKYPPLKRKKLDELLEKEKQRITIKTISRLVSNFIRKDK
jgi:hypothetical protein